MDQEPSTKTLLACTALVLVGFVLGPVTWTLSAPRRAKRSATDSRLLEEMKATCAMLGIMLIGWGAGALADSSPSAWDLALMAIASLVGGLNLGIGFIMIATQGRHPVPLTTRRRHTNRAAKPATSGAPRRGSTDLPLSARSCR